MGRKERAPSSQSSVTQPRDGGWERWLVAGPILGMGWGWSDFGQHLLGTCWVWGVEGGLRGADTHLSGCKAILMALMQRWDHKQVSNQ